ncbi:hypothetical protein CA13_26820 [Planctomycetes bacterium CA13]|uniref:Uncharacterized protein n=1 Tax=Novipirellula herctigrandis TaxID=2527986 RepID=A0A5C5Z1H1_9BACT|nr:hypothetical protein CA13_26820 [Planctomycetes bacterium CA13]
MNTDRIPSLCSPIGLLCHLVLIGLAAANVAAQDAAEASIENVSAERPISPAVTDTVLKPESASLPYEQPWDFLPYRVLVWVVSSDPMIDAKLIEKDLRLYLNRDFYSVWRMNVVDAPASVATAARRNIAKLSFQEISASDPVIAVKRDHPDAVRLRVAKNVGEMCQTVLATSGEIEEVLKRAKQIGNESIDGIASKLTPVDGDAMVVLDKWKDPSTEAILVSRGMTAELHDPEPKLIAIPQSGLVTDAIKSYDKIFIVRIDNEVAPFTVSAIEFDTLMQHFGTVATQSSMKITEIPTSIGVAVTEAFGPVVRIEEAGMRNARGLIRAAGLVLDPESPAMIRVGDVLEPMTRKNDRNGKPITVGPIDWAYLLVKEREQSQLEMDYLAGRAGGLQGRKNKRTFRTAIRVRPVADTTLLRLHAQGDADFPLIGYEIYDKNLETGDMSFVGRTDWNGRLDVPKSDASPLRLMYVKNGGAILARLPMVPGLTEKEIADLTGDDMRLQAEAYIHGVQNAIIDLVAIRQLFAARIRARLHAGEMKEAEDLLNELRDQPTNERLADDMGKKQTVFLKVLGTRNVGQRRKIDQMFTITRELLSKHINPALLRDLGEDVITARNNNGRLPEKQLTAEEKEKQVVDTTSSP